ncbi:MAG: M23 family metallopeptidase [Chitinispirillaceae bacterium]|nr:M23 family metallopeptidase [Chitinispirillaceae bacterium]
MILSPEGRPVKFIRLNPFTVALITVIAVCGVTAFFIPAKIFRAKDEERHHKAHIDAQNEMLNERLSAASRLTSRLEDQISALDRKKKRITVLLGENKAEKEAVGRSKRSYANRLKHDAEKLAREIVRWEAICTAFMASIGDGNPFDTIPVCRPVLSDAAVSQRFGRVKDPFTGMIKWHYGIDYAAPVGTPVIATASGRVARTENGRVWGRKIVINHGKGWTTSYAHLGSILVRFGQKVTRGDEIGTIGASGLTTGPHVHYEVRHHNQPLDPEEYYFPVTDSDRHAQ